jgi:glucose-6-phosphate isomerase
MDLIKKIKAIYSNSPDLSWINDDVSHSECLLEGCHMQLYYGRFNLNKNLMDELLLMPDTVGLSESIKKLFSGNLEAGHTCSRENYFYRNEQWNSFRQFANELHQGGFPQIPHGIENVIHLGTGGSRLGPELLIEALKHRKVASFKPHFISSQDTRQLSRLLTTCHPKNTLFIVASKSFTTAETLANAKVAYLWLKESLPEKEVSAHLLAITANPTLAKSFGCKQTLSFSDAVSGRYSISSPISLIAAAYLGESIFSSFIEGMLDMDNHFQKANWSQNMPVLLALLAIYATNCLSISTRCIIPYANELSLFVPYIQQLSMESLGKYHPEYKTGAITWGGVGTDSQHSIQQLIMQGSYTHTADFIVPKDDPASWKNALAQAQLMQRGNSETGERAIHGGHSSITLFIPSVTPKILGSLIALYEHRCFAQSVLLGINCFDQPGVEAGKEMTRDLSSNTHNELDFSSQELQKLCNPQIPTEELM